MMNLLRNMDLGSLKINDVVKRPGISLLPVWEDLAKANEVNISWLPTAIWLLILSILVPKDHSSIGNSPFLKN